LGTGLSSIEEELTAMVDTTERIARLEREIENLKGTSTQAKPVSASPQLSFDPSSRLSLPASVTRDMVNAVPEAMVRDIVKDHLGRPTALPTVPSRSPGKAGSNWKPEAPLRNFGTERLGKKAPPRDAA